MREIGSKQKVPSLLFEENIDLKYDALEKDIAVVDVFLEDDNFKKYFRKKNNSLFDLISKIGGIWAILVGLSMISIVEFIYWMTIGMIKSYVSPKPKVIPR